jgi:hypothetical protein
MTGVRQNAAFPQPDSNFEYVGSGATAGFDLKLANGTHATLVNSYTCS